MRDFAPVAGSFLACPLVALLSSDSGPVAVAHGRDLVDAERAAGIFVEPAIHAWAAGHETLLTIAGVAYLTLHVPVLIGALAWVYLLRPAAFGGLRTVFLAAQALTVAGWILHPTAPPRLLGEGGFSDTLADLWGPAAEERTTWLQSAYAAMPSGHVAFALIAGGAVLVLARHPLARFAGAMYPVGMVGLTVMTANHYWLDAVGAALVVAASGAVALALHRGVRPSRRVATAEAG